jgi:hypothetical protein
MNERIKELAEQAGLNYHNWITNESNINDGDFKYPRLEDYEKFAELIVKECIRCCEGNSEYKNHTDTEWGKGLASGIGLCKEAMKTHFGVGE